MSSIEWSTKDKQISKVLQMLKEYNYNSTAHELEREWGLFFNMEHFGDLVTNGRWDEADKYLHGFTHMDDNKISKKIIFLIRRQKYIEALNKNDMMKAADTLNDLTRFDDKFQDMALWMAPNKFREKVSSTAYLVPVSGRLILLAELRDLIHRNPVLMGKLQCLIWRSTVQAQLSLSQDLKIKIPQDAFTNLEKGYIVSEEGGIPPIGFRDWDTGLHLVLTLGSPDSAGPAAYIVRVNHQTAPSYSVLMRLSLSGPQVYVVGGEDFVYQSGTIGMLPSRLTLSPDPDDLPKTVVFSIDQSSTVTSMAFHPTRPSLLLVGTNAGDISLWDVCQPRRLAHRTFKVWNSRRSVGLQESVINRLSTASVNCVMWSRKDNFGVAYSKHIVHIRVYSDSNNILDSVEIGAHDGSVNDLAFVLRNNLMFVVTCGDDKAVKVWNAVTGSKMYDFRNHEAPVCSVCTHDMGAKFVISASVDGTIIKVSLFDVDQQPHVVARAPGYSCTTMAYNARQTRLFLGGTNKEGRPFLLECNLCNEKGGPVKKLYAGLGMKPVDTLKFDTEHQHSKHLAVGDESVIKYWKMNNINLLSRVDADGGLPDSPCVGFNNDGTLLAVSKRDNGFKILANERGFHQVVNTKLHLPVGQPGPSSQ